MLASYFSRSSRSRSSTACKIAAAERSSFHAATERNRDRPRFCRNASSARRFVASNSSAGGHTRSRLSQRNHAEQVRRDAPRSRHTDHGCATCAAPAPDWPAPIRNAHRSAHKPSSGCWSPENDRPDGSRDAAAARTSTPDKPRPPALAHYSCAQSRQPPAALLRQSAPTLVGLCRLVKTISLVRGVIFRSTSSGSTRKPSLQTASKNRTFAPRYSRSRSPQLVGRPLHQGFLAGLQRCCDGQMIGQRCPLPPSPRDPASRRSASPCAPAAAHIRTVGSVSLQILQPHRQAGERIAHDAAGSPGCTSGRDRDLAYCM